MEKYSIESTDKNLRGRLVPLIFFLIKINNSYVWLSPDYIDQGEFTGLLLFTIIRRRGNSEFTSGSKYGNVFSK